MKQLITGCSLKTELPKFIPIRLKGLGLVLKLISLRPNELKNILRDAWQEFYGEG